MVATRTAVMANARSMALSPLRVDPPIGQLLDGGFLNFSMACSTEKLPSRWRDGTCWKLVVARTKSVIACFAAASFHDGSGEDCRAPAQTGTNNSGSMTKQMIIPARSFDTFIS